MDSFPALFHDVLPLAQSVVPVIGLTQPRDYWTAPAGGPLDAPGLMPAGSMWRMQFGNGPALLCESICARG